MTAHQHDLPIHHYTGQRAIGLVNGRPVWPIKGGDGTGDGGGAGDEGGTGGGNTGAGGAQYTPPATQADMDRIVEQRLSRERAKFADYDDLKAKAAKHDALEIELGSDKDRAVAAARKEEQDKARGEFTPRMVRAEFKAAAKGLLSDEQLTALLEDLDLSKYVDAKGDIDEDKVTNKIKAFAPAGNGNGSGAGRPRPLGQGNHQQSSAKPGDAGRAMAEKRFGKRD